MDEKDIMMIPLCIYEEAQDSYERDKERMQKSFDDDKKKMSIVNRRLVVVIIILILVIAGMVAGGLIYESSFDKVSYSQDGKGVNNFNMGNQGDVNNEPESNG